jgi:hypothetical protein
MRTHGPPIRVWGPSRWRWPRRVLARPARVYSAFATFFGAAVGVVLLTNQLWLPGAVLLGLVSAAVLLVAGALLTRPHVTLADRHAWGGHRQVLPGDRRSVAGHRRCQRRQGRHSGDRQRAMGPRPPHCRAGSLVRRE